jgi:hypothetical protein
MNLPAASGGVLNATALRYLLISANTLPPGPPRNNMVTIIWLTLIIKKFNGICLRSLGIKVLDNVGKERKGLHPERASA